MRTPKEYNPNLEENAANPKLIPITDREGISQEFHQAFTQIYKKQDVEDSAEAIQGFLESGGDTKPMEYLRSKALTQEESNQIEGEITMAELEYALFKKMKGSSAPVWTREPSADYSSMNIPSRSLLHIMFRIE